MEIGVFTTLSSESADIAVVAQKAEALGFESLTLGEHPFIPVNTTSVHPRAGGRPMSRVASTLVDPLISLARACAVTTSLKVGTGICLVPLRNPLILAKEVATLDHFSGGRFLFGIGAGWVKEELDILGADFEHRWSQTREAVLAMKELWTKDEAEFHGTYYDFPPVKSFPKPHQKPHPPVLLGGMAKNVFKRVVAWGDGWFPSYVTPDDVKMGRATLDRLAAEAGRDPSSISITVSSQLSDPGLIKQFEEAGADRVLIRVHNTEEQAAKEELEGIAESLLD